MMKPKLQMNPKIQKNNKFPNKAKSQTDPEF
jgi:hypothetical protein